MSKARKPNRFKKGHTPNHGTGIIYTAPQTPPTEGVQKIEEEVSYSDPSSGNLTIFKGSDITISDTDEQKIIYFLEELKIEERRRKFLAVVRTAFIRCGGFNLYNSIKEIKNNPVKKDWYKFQNLVTSNWQSKNGSLF